MTRIDEQLLAFARWVIAEHREELGDLDGGSIQDKLIELGLLVGVEVTEPCGELCRCVEYFGEFPATCYRLDAGVLPKLD